MSRQKKGGRGRRSPFPPTDSPHRSQRVCPGVGTPRARRYESTRTRLQMQPSVSETRYLPTIGDMSRSRRSSANGRNSPPSVSCVGSMGLLIASARGEIVRHEVRPPDRRGSPSMRERALPAARQRGQAPARRGMRRDGARDAIEQVGDEPRQPERHQEPADHAPRGKREALPPDHPANVDLAPSAIRIPISRARSRRVRRQVARASGAPTTGGRRPYESRRGSTCRNRPPRRRGRGNSRERQAPRRWRRARTRAAGAPGSRPRPFRRRR